MGSLKRILKAMFAVALCAAIAVSGIATRAATSYAAEKKQPLSVNYCGTTVKLVKDLYGSFGTENSVKLTTVERKWGKPNKKEQPYANNDELWYTWKKGKTKISINNYTGYGLGYAGGIQIQIKDKNASIYGVKVGMKKEKALKKLEKAVGKEKVIVLKEGQSPTGEEKNGCLVSLTSSEGGKLPAIKKSFMLQWGLICQCRLN